MATPIQVEANRANAQLSTGPSSPEGKLKSSHNALKHGLTGQTILLPTDDVEAYQSLVAHIHNKFKPATHEEKLLTQSIADTEWRLLRIPTLEAGIFALGRNELGAEFAGEPDLKVRKAMIEALVQKTYIKDLRNLALQETRLNKYLEKLTAQLELLISDRESLAVDRLNEVTIACDTARRENKRFNLTDFGFEFSMEHIQARAEYMRKHRIDSLPQFDRAWKAKTRAMAA
jgi:hypothetical protein